MENFVITQFTSLYIANDPVGRKTQFLNRQSACFIITIKGKIRFTGEGSCLVAQAGAPVFLPQGFSYLNECLETAESYVFNFQTAEQNHQPMQLTAISDGIAVEYYERINAISDSPLLSDRLSLFEILYSLAGRLMRRYAREDKLHPVVTKAMHFILQNYGSPEITVKEVACHCCVSEVYLRKLFEKELHTSPSRKITELRMGRAKMLIDEKRPLKEIAAVIGYSDVFQFSRAYKRYFGHAPSKNHQ